MCYYYPHFTEEETEAHRVKPRVTQLVSSTGDREKEDCILPHNVRWTRDGIKDTGKLKL